MRNVKKKTSSFALYRNELSWLFILFWFSFKQSQYYAIFIVFGWKKCWALRELFVKKSWTFNGFQDQQCFVEWSALFFGVWMCGYNNDFSADFDWLDLIFWYASKHQKKKGLKQNLTFTNWCLHSVEMHW
jgi:hypothetical protein